MNILIYICQVAYVVVEGIKVNIIVDDMPDRNRAHQGYTVAVELYPESEWIPFSRKSEEEEEDDDKKESSVPASTADVQLDLQKMRIGDEVDDNSQRVRGLWRPRDDLLQPFHSSNKPVEEQVALTAGGSVHPLDQISGIGKKQPRGRVVAILEACEHKRVIGALSVRATLRPNEPLPESESFVTFQPSDGRIPYMIVPRVQLPDAFVQNPFTMISHIYVADLVPDWPASSKLPFGENIRSVGEVGSIQAETEALLIEKGLNHGLFTDEAIEPLRELLGMSTLDSTSGADAAGNWTIPPDEIAKRRDLRAYRIFTIDPSGARDLDDALHISPIAPEDPNGEMTYEVGVHIADVSHFVVPDTPLDAEARNRATSIYLVQKVIPMLPPILCEQLCSLNPNVDRLAFSVIFRMTADGNLVAGHRPWFGRTVIRSCAKLDYVTAQRMVDGEIPNRPSGSSNCDSEIDSLSDDVWNLSRRPSKATPGGDNRYIQNAWEIAMDVCTMHRVAMSRRSRRLENGALVLNRPKLTFRLDENGNPVSTSCYIIRESNQLIEEYMLLANYLVAEKLLETVGAISFLRLHPPPDMNGLGTLVDLSQHIGHELDITSAMTLQESLKHISEQADSTTIRVITSLIMRPMQRAEYFVVGESEPEHWRHYALSIPYYTHFTSPIRRYADVMVHRLLEEGLLAEAQSAGSAAASVDRLGFDHARYKATQAIADHCNMQKDASKAAQERSDAVYLSIFLVNNATMAEGIVSGIGEKSFTVLVIDYSFESRLFIDKMHNVESTYDEKEKTLVLRHRPHTAESKGCYHEFSEMTVSLMSRVWVRLSADMTPPITVKVDLVSRIA
jgi:exoribonuclease R